MKNALIRTALATTLAAALGSAQAATVTSTFDTGLDGWTTYANGGDSSLVFEPTGGQSGGYLRDVDTTDTWGWLLAPSAYTDALQFAGNGQLSFYLKTFSGNDAPQFPVRVAISNGSLSLMAAGFFPNDASFGSFSFSFDSSTAWRVVLTDLQQGFDPADAVATDAQIASVLGSLTGIYIAADYNGNNVNVGGVDHTLLDTVELNVTIPDGNTPEPMSAALVLGALAGLGLARRRRR